MAQLHYMFADKVKVKSKMIGGLKAKNHAMHFELLITI